MTKAAVRHTDTDVAMLGQTGRQNKAAIAIASREDTSAVSNSITGAITVHAESKAAVSALGAIAEEHGATVTLWYVDSFDDPVFEVRFDD